MKFCMMLLACLVLTSPLNGSERLTMTVTPAVAFAPANLRVLAIVEAASTNRAIEVIAESPDFYRSSQIQLEGEHAPRTNVFEYRDVPSGTYDVSAVLIDASGRRLTVHREINVIGEGVR